MLIIQKIIQNKVEKHKKSLTEARRDGDHGGEEKEEIYHEPHERARIIDTRRRKKKEERNVQKERRA